MEAASVRGYRLRSLAGGGQRDAREHTGGTQPLQYTQRLGDDPPGEPGGGDQDLRGALLALGASVFYAAYLLVMAEARREIDVFSGLFLMTLGAAGVLGAAAFVRGDAFAGFPSSSWAVMLASAAVSQLIGVLGIVWALRYLPPTLASVALLGQPIAAAGLAWWILAEPLGVLQGLGAAAVLAGIALASTGERAHSIPSNSRGVHQGK